MNKLIFCLSILITFAGSIRIAAAQNNPAVEYSMHYGWQQENLRWSIAGTTAGTNPNILSELTWRHNQGFAAGADLKLTLFKHVRLIAAFNRLQVSSGQVTDTDYGEDNRTNIIYAGSFENNKGYSTAYTIGGGYDFSLYRALTVTPSIGYTNNRQTFYLLDFSGALPGLNSSYATRWRGVYAGLEAGLQLVPALKMVATATYSQIKYNATGNWNLRIDFAQPVSYRHKANGYGLDAGLKFVARLNKNISLSAGGSYFNWQTGLGIDELYKSNGSIQYAQMNGAYRNGYMLTGGTVFSF